MVIVNEIMVYKYFDRARQKNQKESIKNAWIYKKKQEPSQACKLISVSERHAKKWSGIHWLKSVIFRQSIEIELNESNAQLASCQPNALYLMH